ncbi:hypothetical protein SISSUDRAFT_973627, partial [Sistotremastrum suecicum HHB10207 ss-3]
ILIWITRSLSPQEIREKLADNDEAFQTALIKYLEDCHKGGFFGGSAEDIQFDVAQEQTMDNDYIIPMDQLPKAMPVECQSHCGRCTECLETNKFLDQYKKTVDDILMRTNTHKCSPLTCKKQTEYCKARFPRAIIESTTVDPETGHLTMRHQEEYLNTVSPILTYLLRCNSDVTSLLSGTAIKAVVAYVCDYI